MAGKGLSRIVSDKKQNQKQKSHLEGVKRPKRTAHCRDATLLAMPFDSGVEAAKRANMGLVGQLKKESMLVFANEWRVRV
jgi:hypothetical protein